MIQQIHAADRLAMADVSTFEEALAAEKDGFDIVSTTLLVIPNIHARPRHRIFELLKEIVDHVNIPVIMEGRIQTDRNR